MVSIRPMVSSLAVVTADVSEYGEPKLYCYIPCYIPPLTQHPT